MCLSSLVVCMFSGVWKWKKGAWTFSRFGGVDAVFVGVQLIEIKVVFFTRQTLQSF